MAEYGTQAFFLATPPPEDISDPKLIINFPVAAQRRDNAHALINSELASLAIEREYIFIVPFNEERALMRQNAGTRAADFVEQMQAELGVSPENTILMGASSGGMTVLRLAAVRPDVASVAVAYPGVLWDEDADITKLNEICVQIYTGSRDTNFVREHRNDMRRFRKAGVKVFSRILQDVGHNFGSYKKSQAKMLLNNAQVKKGCALREQPTPITE